MDYISPTLRSSIAFGASRGMAHTIFHGLPANLGSAPTLLATIIATIFATYATYRLLGAKC